jgi:hypothetical protein
MHFAVDQAFPGDLPDALIPAPDCSIHGESFGISSLRLTIMPSFQGQGVRVLV